MISFEIASGHQHLQNNAIIYGQVVSAEYHRQKTPALANAWRYLCRDDDSAKGFISDHLSRILSGALQRRLKTSFPPSISTVN